MSIGVWQLVLIIILVLVLFGAGKLPHVMGEIGKGVKNFKDALNGNDSKDKKDEVK